MINVSYWEIKTWLENVDYTVVGSGIVGLNCAISLKKRFPKSKIVVLEKGVFPHGASTKNAGFACFGSLSEILDDLKSHSEEEVKTLINKRIQGLKLLRENLGDKTISYHQNGGYELFSDTDNTFFNECISQIENINKLLYSIFKQDTFYLNANKFGFKNIQNQYVFTPFEGQLDTGEMMNALIIKAQTLGIKILNNITVKRFSDITNSVHVDTNYFDFKTSKLFIATNGFASQLLNESVKPARAQILITKPIDHLHIKGTFHLDKGYYYFRNINDRVLFGGGRNLDFKTEETTEFGQTDLIQNHLEMLLKNTILPGISFEIDHRWSGIMGVGCSKRTIVKQVSDNVFCGVRLGGMGVAIGSLIGNEMTALLE